ncbi:hypothetical protein [Alteribacillus sp. HJP-4]|uniref:hypothetical protein n=1 Tax=Alteribacillus sp. HJP-4 TaxID=2775394 RepID=UPI0035CD07EA
MEENQLFFTDNFFSAGLTEIFNGHKEYVGKLDLKGAFSASIQVLDKEENVLVKGEFPFFSNKWSVLDSDGGKIGEVKAKFALFQKKYEYIAVDRGVYAIESEAFSRDFRMIDQQKQEAASFTKTSSFFESPAYRLNNYSDDLENEELVAVVMGVNMIMKRQNSNNSGAAAN